MTDEEARVLTPEVMTEWIRSHTDRLIAEKEARENS